ESHPLTLHDALPSSVAGLYNLNPTANSISSTGFTANSIFAYSSIGTRTAPSEVEIKNSFPRSNSTACVPENASTHFENEAVVPRSEEHTSELQSREK